MLFILLVVVICHISSVTGLHQTGVSLNIAANIPIKSIGWKKIEQWKHPVDSGHVITGTFLKLPNKADVHIPYSGIYLALVTATLTGADIEGRFKVALVINDRLNNSHHGMTSSILGGPLGPKSLSVGGALSLQCNDHVSLYVYSEKDTDWSVSGQSETTFSLQFVESLGAVPGFSAVIKEPMKVNQSGWKILREWRYTNTPGLFKSMTGFSKHVGEFVAIFDGIYFIAANIRIETNSTSYFDLGIAIDSVQNGSIIRKMSSKEFTLSVSTSVNLKKGQIISLKINSYGATYTIGAESGFSATRIGKQSANTPGFSMVLENDVTGSGGGWIRIAMQSPNGTSFGQYNGLSKFIADGKYYPPQDGIFVITASIRLIAESLIGGSIFTRVLSGDRLSGNVLGLYYGLTKTDYRQEVTFTTNGMIRLLQANPLSFYIYMQNAGNYKILAGSRISVMKTETKYPAFHATLDANVQQSSDNAWVEVSSWKVDKALGSYSLTDFFTNGRFSAKVSGIYHVSSNIIFDAPASYISLLISVNGGQSKRKALFSTKGNPWNKDTLSVSGALKLKKNEFISVHVKATGTSSWSISEKSSFSLAFMGLPFAVPGFSAVFSTTKSFNSDGWHQLKYLLTIDSDSPLFHYGGGLDLTNCKYQAPISGLYIVNANLKLKRAARVGAEFTANVAIDNNPGSTTYLNGINDFVARSIVLGSEDFYSLNVAGVLKLKANQNITLWIKSKSAGTWELSEDSSCSVILAHVENNFHSSGFQAVLNPLISQSVTGATSWKLIRSWVTSRNDGQAGPFNLDKYQDVAASSGTVTIRESGLYFISAAITLKNAAGKFEVGVHLESKLAGLYCLVDTSGFGHYTMKMFGMLYIDQSQTLSIQVQAPLKRNWEQDILYSGLSFVKVAPFEMPFIATMATMNEASVGLSTGKWTRVTNWVTSETQVQNLIGAGYSKANGFFTAQTDGIYIVSGFLETDTTSLSPTVQMKIALNANLSSIMAPNYGQGLTTLNSDCNKSCTLHTSAAMYLKVLDTVALFVSSNDVEGLTIKKGSMFSVSLVAESNPLPVGMFGLLKSPQTISVKGDKQVTAWQPVQSSGSFKSSENMDSFNIKSSGIYFVTITIKFQNLQGLAKAVTSLVNIPAITSMNKGTSNAPFVLSISGSMKIAAGSLYTVTVYSETDSDYQILNGSSKSVVFLGTSVIGFTATQSQTRTILLLPNIAYHITGWSTVGKDWLFEAGNGFADRRSFIVPQTGVYHVSANIVISYSINSTAILVSLGIQRDGFIKQEYGLVTTSYLVGTKLVTLTIAGTVFLEKWTQLKLIMQTSKEISVEMNIDSTFSIVKTNKDLSEQKDVDNGPNIIGHLNPEVLRTSYKKPVGWTCEAVGISVTYGWMKNYNTIPGKSLPSLQIPETKVSDTGEYVCTAIHDGIRVSSNIAKLTIYDPIPVFLNPVEQYNLSVPENGPQNLGLLNIVARARSLNNAYAMMSFEIISGNINGTFYLFPTRSDKMVTLMRNVQLDRESRDNYTIYIKATNLEAYSFQIQQINITVKDLNDNRPIFTQSTYQASINENTTVGTTVARVLATDRDIGENAIIKYWFIPSSAKTVFSVNPNTGYVTLQGPVDRETRDLYVIFVKAYDKSFDSYSELSIRILDINEHAPVFHPDFYAVNVSETLLPGSSVVTVTASDNDTGLNAELTYTLVSGDPQGIFRITKYGTIQNKQRLNYEQNTSFSLIVSVRDNGQPPLHANKTATVNVYVTDANDNSPKFDNANYVINLLENATVGQVISTVHAFDKDAPGQPESTLSYAMEGSSELLNMFIINSTTGVITLNATLDYEMTSSYRFTVTAKDAGTDPLQDKAQVLINVIDVNDNKPRFSHSKSQINVTESSQINREIFRVVATDKDSGMNAEIRYNLKSGDVGNTFTIDPISGVVIAIKPLDRERTPFYSLVITCQDMGNPQLYSPASFQLDINVLDENDNSPVFNSQVYTTKILENTTIGSTILIMTVRDSDAAKNGQFNLTIVEKSAQRVFKYNQSAGALILASKLDFELQSSYHFTVVAKDHGIPPLEKSAVVDIQVLDINDNAPRFAYAHYDSQIQDMVFENVTVYQLIATDPDIGPSGKISYEIVNGNSNGQFKIGTHTGIVETAKNLNTTFITSFRLEIVAKDGFHPPAVSNRTTLTIHVTKTPSIKMTSRKAGTTSLEAVIDVSEFAHLKIISYQVLVQEYKPEDANFNMISSLQPISWFAVNVNPKTIDVLRRYIAVTVTPASLSSLASSKTRKRRATYSAGKINVVIGVQTGCEKKIKPEDICNGPLKPNKEYRLQIRGFVQNSKFPRDSHFTVPVRLGAPAATVAKLVDFGSKDGTIGLAIAFCCCTILAIIIIIGIVQYRRKHQILNVEHVNKEIQLKSHQGYVDPATSTSGFGPLSDIGMWPQMSMAEQSHMFQRSQGSAEENFQKVPRSPGDSGINHAYDDDDSWKLNMSDDGDEPWEASQNVISRGQNIGLLRTMNNAELQRQSSRLRDNSDSNTSLETNTEHYQPPRLSESLRNVFKNEENKVTKQISTNQEANMSIITEESDNEIETEFGPEIETSLGPDADLSSIDEEPMLD